MIFPIGSGVLLAAGFVSALAQANTASLVLYWAGLLLGASTFVPGALRALLKGRLGISLLMMIMSIPKIKRIYQKSGSYIDIVSGSFFLLFAIFLWVDVLKMF